MRVAGLLALLTWTAFAQEPDGAVAPASRWTAPHGPASGSRRSGARPVLGPLERAFTITLPGPALHAPVHWDGLAYVLCGGTEWTLVAIDLYLGELVAKKTVPAQGGIRPVVWNHIVVLNHRKHLAAYRRYKKTFKQVWKTGGEGAFGDPTMVDGEIYVVDHGVLQRRAVGMRADAWSSAAIDPRGPPVVYGDEVYICGHASEPGFHPHLMLYAYDRKTGARLGSAKMGHYAGNPGKLPSAGARYEITVVPNAVYVRPPRPIAGVKQRFSITIANRKVKDGNLVLTGGSIIDADLTPSGHRDGIIVRTTKKGVMKWQRWYQREIYEIASSRHHPDLLQRRVPAVVLGDVVYFGHWAADIRTRDVLWRLPFQDVRLPCVPADGLVLVVENPNVLHAFRTKGAP